MGDPVRTVLVTGATGYIGGRLVPRLIERGYRVRCLARHPSHLEGRGWTGVEVVAGDVLDPASLGRALAGMDAAYYLVHSMAAGSEFERRDRAAAHAFARAAKAAGVRRVVYLGGLGDPARGLSPHLLCRQEVGAILREEGPPTTEFRAAVIVGSGSLSFEMIRHIVEQHPVIPVFPRLRTRCQPIAVRDVLGYLTAALEVPASAGRVLEIGGRDILTYEDMLRVYAKRRGLRRWFVPVPRVSAALCARWIEWMTPIPAGFARPLLDGVKDEVVVRDHAAREMFPIVPLDFETALRYALLRIKEGRVETAWTMALLPKQKDFSPLRVVEGLVCEERRVAVDAPSGDLFAAFCGIGGERGWFYAGWLWRLRGLLDRVSGGPGLRRGRRDRDAVVQGEALDFWRVERVLPGRLLLLRAEMKVPGKAWLQFESLSRGRRRSTLRITAYFDPKGFWGRAYWYALIPSHKVLLSGLARELRDRAVARRREREGVAAR